MSQLDVADSIAVQRAEQTSIPRRSQWRVGALLALIVVSSFAVRIAAWKHWGTGAIESEGAEYARLAQNLRHGVGFVGLVTPGAQLNFNPLFPVMIAGASFVTHDYELAGRLVALVMGTLLPLPVFGIASRVFSRRVGFVAAVLALLHPLLLHLSFTVFSEGPYITLFLTAAWLTLRAIENPSIGNWLLCGGGFGLAWLVRAEATAGLAIAVLFAIVATPGPVRSRFVRAAAALAMFIALASPQILHIYRYTGELRMEVKSRIFFYTGNRILAANKHPGVAYESPGGHYEMPSAEPNVESSQRWQDKWAFYGIDTNLKGMGFPLRPHVEVVRATRLTLRDLVSLIARGVRQNAPELFRTLSADWVGAPFLTALALLGALQRPWQGPQRVSRAFVLLISCAPVAATFFALWSEQRYYFVFIPLLCVWAANGLVQIGLWADATFSDAGWTWLAHPAISQALIPGFIGLAMILSAIQPVGRLYVFADSAPPTRVDKEIGRWIARQQTGSVKIIDVSIPLAFHADAQFTYFPYCTGDVALRYLDAAQVDYIVLRRDQKFTHYYEDWLTRGIPDARAERLLSPEISGMENYVIYRWHRNDLRIGSTYERNEILGRRELPPHGL